ncbi:nuclear transport factor 2 family protein [Amycolatopsis sp. NPDC059657]|uniref:nuclear transport factor 2 family protein n=1 Tax=Amycolatopsis sp. NPDC059657 TaxID=3346899 RepID=UPI0036731149
MRIEDRIEITEMIDRFFLALDDGTVGEDWVRSQYTEDVRSEAPVYTAVGHDEVLANTREAIGRFERTQHVGSNYVIDFDGDDKARVRGNAIMTHIHKDRPEAFTVGGVFDNDLVRTPEGWRVSKTAMRVIWTSGEPPRF